MKSQMLSVILSIAAFAGAAPAADNKPAKSSSSTEAGFVALFPEDGIPKGWLVRKWDDVKNPAGEGVVWKVENGILRGSIPRGTWLVSEQEYGDFILEFEFKLGERGNSGCGLRFPLYGDPAFDGLELQMVDPRYFPNQQAAPDELTGGLYRAIAPNTQQFKPAEWNRYQLTCQGPLVKVRLNGETILDVNLDEQTKRPKRHDGSEASPLKERPRKGHIGFQELSRTGQAMIRHARIKVLN